MSIKLVDTLEPMADFPAAMAENIGFADSKSLQEKYDSGELGGTLIIAYITGSLYSTSIEYIGTRIALYFTKGAMYYVLGYGGKYYPTSSWNASSGGGPMWYKIASTLV